MNNRGDGDGDAYGHGDGEELGGMAFRSNTDVHTWSD